MIIVDATTAADMAAAAATAAISSCFDSVVAATEPYAFFNMD